MAYGHKAFRKLQISNVEGTPGTAEAATEILYPTQVKQLFSSKVFHSPEQDRGVLAMHYETPFQVSEQIELDIEADLYDRLAVFMFCNSIRGNVTATQPDNINEPNHYKWLLEPALTAPNTPDQTDGIDTFTIEYGDNVQAYEVEYLFTRSIEITGAPNEPITCTWSVSGRQVTETSFTGALTNVAAAYFPFNLAKIYIESDSYANIGTTQKTGLLKGFTWTFETMFSARWTADGNFYFTALNENKKTVNLEMTFLRDGTTEAAEFDAWLAQTIRYIRIELLSHTEMDSGQANPPYIWLDGAFRYTEYPEYDEEDGTSLVTVTAQAVQDTTASKMFGVSVGTTMSAFA